MNKGIQENYLQLLNVLDNLNQSKHDINEAICTLERLGLPDSIIDNLRDVFKDVITLSISEIKGRLITNYKNYKN